MKSLQSFTQNSPILSFLILCYGITWAIWFSVPHIAGSDWAFGKIIVGAGFGPALAAIILAQLNGSGCSLRSPRWWIYFSAVFIIICSIYTSILISGDGITLAQFEQAVPVGFSSASIFSVIASSTVAGFIVACLVCSRNSRLNSILKWRVHARWWIVALFLPASWMLLGLFTADLVDSPIQPLRINFLAPSHTLFLLRSVIFTFLVVAIGEEAGWRAWLLPELQKRFSPLLSSFFLGLVWGGWHFPLFVIGQYAESPVFTFAKMGACVLLATMFTWLYNRSSQSLLIAAVFHTALNSTPKMIPLTEQAGLYVIAILIGIILYDKMWEKS